MADELGDEPNEARDEGADLLDELWRDPFVEYPPPRRLELLGREELREPRLKLIEALAAEDWRRAMRVRQALRESTVDEAERAAVELYTAWIYAERGEWDRALDYYQTVIQGARAWDQRALEIEGLLGVGLCEAKRNNFDPADHVLSYARELARGTDSRPLELCALRRRALTAAAAGRGEQAVALLDEALRTANEARELWMVARLEQDLARIHFQSSEYSAALEAHQRAADLYRILDHPRGELYQLAQMGDVLQARGRYDEAVALLRGGVERAAGLADRRLEALFYANLGAVFYRRGDYEESRGAFEGSLQASRDCRDARATAKAYNNLGVINFKLGRDAEALRCYREALDGERRLRNELSEGRILGNLGLVHYRQGRLNDCRTTIGRALEIFTRKGCRHDEAISLANLALTHLESGEIEQATSLAHRSFKLARELDVPRTEAHALANLGLVSLELGDVARAADLLQRSLEIDLRLGSPTLEAEDRLNIGRLHLGRGEWTAAAESLRQAAELFGRLKEHHNELRALTQLAVARAENGAAGDAVELLERSRRLLDRVASPNLEALFQFCLGWVSRCRGEFAAAEGALRRALNLYHGQELCLRELRVLHQLARLAEDAGRLDTAYIYLHAVRDRQQTLKAAPVDPEALGRTLVAVAEALRADGVEPQELPAYDPEHPPPITG